MSKIVKIKLIDKKGNSSFNGWTRYNNTVDYISPYFTKERTLYTGLTDEQAKEFGKELNQDLSPLSNFWHDYKITVRGKEVILNLDSVMDRLHYEFLKNHYRIAESLTDPNIGIKDYYIVDENKEAEVVNNKASLKMKANILFSKLSVENKKDILKLYPGFTNMDTVSNEVVDARLYEFMEADPAKFISQAEDKKRDLKVLLKDLVSSDILRKNKTSYYYGQDFLGHDEESTIEYIEHPDHQGLKIDLMKQLEVKNKKK